MDNLKAYQILLQIDMALVVLDSSYRIDFLNDKARDLIGDQRKIQEGNTCYKFFYHRSEACAFCPVKQIGKDFKTEDPTFECMGQSLKVETQSVSIHSESKNILTLSPSGRGFKSGTHQWAEYTNTIFKASPVGIGVVVKNEFSFVNASLCELTGYSPEDLIGQSAKILFPEEGEFRRFAKIGNTDREKNTSAGIIETQWRCKDDSIKDISISYVPLTPDDSLSGVTFIAQDISKGKKIKRKYQQSESKYKNLIETAADAIIIADRDSGCIVQVNEKATELTGYSQTKLIGKHILSLHPSDQESLLVRDFKKVAKGKRIMTQTEILHKSGKRIPVEINPSHFSDESGQNLVIGFFRDLSQRIKWQKALNEIELKYDVLFETVKEGIIFLNHRSGEFKYVNPAMCEFLEYEKGELERLGMKDIHPPKSYKKIKGNIVAALKEEISTLQDVPCLTKNGRIVYADVHVTYINIDEGQYTAVFFNDTTQRKITEQKLRKNHRKLEESDNNYRMLFNEMANGFAVHEMLYDENGKAIDYRFLEVNAAFEKLTGLKEKDIIGKTLFEVLPNIEDVWIHEYEKVARSGKPVSFIQNAKALNRYYEVLAYSPKKNFFATVFSDVTDRIKTHRKLEESEERYRKLIESSPNIILVIQKSRILFANNMAISTSGYRSFEALEKINALDLVHPDDMDIMKQRIEREESGLKNDLVELRLLRKEGSSILVENISLPIVYNNKPASLIICTDISERRKAEYAAIEIENTIRNIQKGLASKVGEKFFETMVIKLAKILKADYAFVGELEEKTQKSIQTISFYKNGRIGRKFTYDLKDTPCSTALKEGICSYSENIAERFPKDEMLSEMGIEGYIGIPLKDSLGNTVGIMVALFKKAISNLEFAKTIMDIFSARAGAEIVRMRVEKDLAKANISFRTIAENLPDILLRVDTRFECTYVSPNVFEYTGIQANEFIGKKLSQVKLDPDFSKNREQDFKKLLKGKKSLQTVISVHTEKGNRILEWRMLPEFDHKGKVESILNMIRDLTETRRTETELNQLFNLSADLICIVNKSGPFLKVNPAWETTLGYSEQELLEIPFFDLIHPEDLENTRQLVKGKRKNKKRAYSFENRYRCKDGSYKWLSWVTQPFGKEGLMFAIARDITDKKLMVEELIKSKEKAEESDNLKSAFLANMSHEIRTPMNAIIGFSSLLSRDEVTIEKRKYYSNIIQARSSDLLSIINDILDISKIESNQIQIVKEEFSINEIFKELLEDLKQKLVNFPAKSVELKIGKRAEPPFDRIVGDRLRIKQVLTNLIDNAIKFTNKGEIVFGCIYHSSTIQFYVSDTGIGIPKEMQAQIFERFRQAEDSTTRKYGGNGLGLSISKALVELMGGEVWLDSIENTGASFFFSIPDVVRERGSKIVQERRIGEGIDLIGKKILIVEDEPLSREYLGIVIKQVGGEVYYAATGIEALHLFNQDLEFDLILMDIHLPDIDGLEITRTIRSSNPNIPIIAQTAFAMSEDKKKSLDSGCTEYLSKPIKSDDLLEVIQKLLFE